MAKITGAQCLADMLQGYGVSHVFMVPAVLRRTFVEAHGACRVRKFVAVPVERIAAGPNGRVAGAEMKAVAGNPVVPALFDEVRNPRIGVRRVRDGHRRGGETQCPFRREGLTARQPGKAPHHIRNTGSREDIEIEVTILRTVGPEQPMVVIDRAAEIHLADSEIVIEDAVRTRRAVDDDERDHLIERIAQFRVEAARIHRVDLEAAARVIERACLVAHAIMALVLITRHDMLKGASLA